MAVLVLNRASMTEARFVCFGRRLCKNTNFGEAHRISFSNSPNYVLITHDIFFENTLNRNSFYQFLARGRFHTAWSDSGHGCLEPESPDPGRTSRCKQPCSMSATGYPLHSSSGVWRWESAAPMMMR